MELKNPFLTADYPGFYRDYLTRETGAEALFVQGASGDLVPKGDELGMAAARRTGENLAMADYTLSVVGPGKYFASEAERAKRNGLRLFAQANCGGRTWDFGTVPFEPCPQQWARR